LFSESNSRYVLEVTPEKYDAFAKRMLNLPFGQVGEVTAEPKLVIRSGQGGNIVDANIDILKEAWQRTFDWR
jgi:phosphoribosylformylglycinamidine synthase